jgi:hypothetical protein
VQLTSALVREGHGLQSAQLLALRGTHSLLHSWVFPVHITGGSTQAPPALQILPGAQHVPLHSALLHLYWHSSCALQPVAVSLVREGHAAQLVQLSTLRGTHSLLHSWVFPVQFNGGSTQAPLALQILPSAQHMPLHSALPVGHLQSPDWQV